MSAWHGGTDGRGRLGDGEAGKGKASDGGEDALDCRVELGLAEEACRE